MKNTYRLYRRLTTTQYRDVLADDEHDARKNGAMYSLESEWTVTDMNHITDTLVTTPDNPVQGVDVFIDRDVKQSLNEANS